MLFRSSLSVCDHHTVSNQGPRLAICTQRRGNYHILVCRWLLSGNLTLGNNVIRVKLWGACLCVCTSLCVYGFELALVVWQGRGARIFQSSLTAKSIVGLDSCIMNWWRNVGLSTLITWPAPGSLSPASSSEKQTRPHCINELGINGGSRPF